MVSVGVYFAEYVYFPALEIAVLELDHAHEPAVFPVVLGREIFASVKLGAYVAVVEVDFIVGLALVIVNFQVPAVMSVFAS